MGLPSDVIDLVEACRRVLEQDRFSHRAQGRQRRARELPARSRNIGTVMPITLRRFAANRQ